MHADDSIRPACPEDIPALADVERAAAQRYSAVGIDGRFLDGVVPTRILADAQSDGRLWVARHQDRCVGFALVSLSSPRAAWLEELDVHPDHGQRGLGRALVKTAIEWARRQHLDSISLSTFDDVAWNGPFYRRLGFREVAAAAYSAEIRAVVEEERGRGLPMDRRVVLRLDLATGDDPS